MVARVQSNCSGQIRERGRCLAGGWLGLVRRGGSRVAWAESKLAPPYCSQLQATYLANGRLFVQTGDLRARNLAPKF
jgi:hypothetical protein